MLRAYTLFYPIALTIVHFDGTPLYPSTRGEDEQDDTSSRVYLSDFHTDRQSQLAIVLKQSRDNEKFTFRASSDSDVVLKYPD
jgi:hypothetical protein